jgi:hypothetical protein
MLHADHRNHSLKYNIQVKAAAKTPPKQAKRRGRPPKSEKEKEWEVEYVVDKKIDSKSQETSYLVKWKNYPEDSNTWEPEANLGNCQRVIRLFEAQQVSGKKKGRKSKG